MDAHPTCQDDLVPGQGPGEVLDPQVQPPTLAKQSRIGNYRILKPLGRGGMGMVYLALDLHLERQVALKVMLPEVGAHPEARQRFLREARAAAKLRNDHIVTIHQVSEVKGVPYLAMELLEGQPLEEGLQAGQPLPLPEILRIGREIAKGLEAAHAQGIIHRDIKPGNIWLDQAHGNRVKILDFGLARSVKKDIHLTQSGAIVGTPAYMAPEQARGSRDIDSRADLFSLGCVLYHLCVGAIPFKGETTMEVLLANATNQPVPPRDLNDQVPPALSDLILRLLAKDPADRPPTARSVIQELQAMEKILAQPSVSRTEASTLFNQKATPRRSPGNFSRALIAMGLIAAIVAVGFLYYPAVEFLKPNDGVELKQPSGFAAPGHFVAATEVKMAEEPIAALHRRIAEWVLNQPGKNKVFCEGGWRFTVAELPRTPFFVRQVGFREIPNVQAFDVTPLEELQELQQFSVGSCDFTDADVERLLPTLNALRVPTLALASLQITDRTIDLLRQVPSVSTVYLYGNTKITPPAYLKLLEMRNITRPFLSGMNDHVAQKFAEERRLEALGLDSPKSLSPTLLATLVKNPALKQLELTGMPCEDDDLAILAELKELEYLRFHRARITAEGVRKLADALPGCRIVWDGGVLEPKVTGLSTP